ncbi:hypothetical protein BaRGS_00020928 [Batillaria attramentaria]|uniref:Voltage-gated hydrogen channel 1 n=1 Tax=Batillaria attramentaria TaxID=370345 RepID=A0ABD0KLV5_9CAEN
MRTGANGQHERNGAPLTPALTAIQESYYTTGNGEGLRGMYSHAHLHPPPTARVYESRVILKVFCAGSHFVKRKIEVFDAVIILASFVVDLVFLKGLQAFPIDDSIFILAFLLPWRVIRVVNTDPAALTEHKAKQGDLAIVAQLNEFPIDQTLLLASLLIWSKFAPRRRKDSKFYTLVKLVMSTASVADDRDSVSSSSIENDIRAIANRDSVLNINECSNSNENTVTSFGGYDSRSISDVDSFRGNFSNSPTPSPDQSPITSPHPSPTPFLRVPGGPSVFKFDDTQSLTSEQDGVPSRPSTPNILLTAPSTENALCDLGSGIAETSLSSGGHYNKPAVMDGRLKGKPGGMTFKVDKVAELHTAPPSPYLTVPNSHGVRPGGKSRISDSHSMSDINQDMSGKSDANDTTRRASCLSLNADAKGRRRKSPRRVNFDLS